MAEEILNRIGLNEYERKVYLFLINRGNCGAVEISRRAGVPFGRVYDILYQLESKGFIKVILTSPKQFAAIEPKVAIKSALKKIEDEFNGVIKKGEDDLDKLQDLFVSKEEDKRPSVWIVSGKENIQNSRKQDFLRVNKTYNAIISPDVSTPFAPVIERLAREAQAKGLKRRFIESKDSDKEKIAQKKKGGAEIRFSAFKGFSMAILDSNIVRIEINDNALGRTSVILENIGFAKAMDEYFEYVWKSKSKYSSSIR